ncbi:MAG: hypothetical protein OCU16_07225 [Candidatus Methanospirare jalkutatii]|nr:hypothetical protein [Candidatus Methanospirare jalkutatii]
MLHGKYLKHAVCRTWAELNEVAKKLTSDEETCRNGQSKFPLA